MWRILKEKHNLTAKRYVIYIFCYELVYQAQWDLSLFITYKYKGVQCKCSWPFWTQKVLLDGKHIG